MRQRINFTQILDEAIRPIANSSWISYPLTQNNNCGHSYSNSKEPVAHRSIAFLVCGKALLKTFRDERVGCRDLLG